MRIMTIVGTRPELIRLSLIIPKLDILLGKNHILIHTGQNYDKNLSDIFFEELNIRLPDYFMNAKGTFAQQIGKIMTETEQVINLYKPDKVLILGDTNTGLSAFVVERMGIPVYHLEAGNRSYNRELPEEINRLLIDHISTINISYTSYSRENLLREGINPKCIFVSGNPIYEVIKYNKVKINRSNILTTLNLKSRKYVLVTLHRSNNVDNIEILNQILSAYNLIAMNDIKVIISTHPRTKSKMINIEVEIHKNVNFLSPFGFFDFVQLEKNAKCILTDSGTVQEEACILQVPCVVTRKATERPETIECGATILAGIDQENIYEAYLRITKTHTDWIPPKEYLDRNVSNKVINYLQQAIRR